MPLILFDKIIFGPIQSRRLGRSLGINLLPEDIKLCTFNCVYCECGWAQTDTVIYEKLLPSDTIIDVLRQRFAQLCEQKVQIDSITYSGNGEPTLHRDFAIINAEIIALRNKYFPHSIISCLSNSTQLYRKDVLEALQAIDNPIMKLDCGSQSMFQLINKPFTNISLDEITENLRLFDGKLTVQTLFLRGKDEKGILIDNTSEQELALWIDRLKIIKPQKVMLYSIDRKTPNQSLEKIEKEELETIAQRLKCLNIKTFVY